MLPRQAVRPFTTPRRRIHNGLTPEIKGSSGSEGEGEPKDLVSVSTSPSSCTQLHTRSGYGLDAGHTPRVLAPGPAQADFGARLRGAAFFLAGFSASAEASSSDTALSDVADATGSRDFLAASTLA